MRYNNYNRGRHNNQRRKNGVSRSGQTYVWRLSWYDSRARMDKCRTFRSKVEALALKSKLDIDYYMYCVKLEKWEG